MRLFQDRDGGARVLEAWIVRQPPARGRLLETCSASHSALARAGAVSRVHVIKLMRDGCMQAADPEGGRLTAAPELSDDAARYYASLLVVIRKARFSEGRVSPG